jgi:hypothetical protein
LDFGGAHQRWKVFGGDIVGGFAHVTRSLCQVKDKLTFKGTKTGKERRIAIADVTMEALRRQQAEQLKARAMFPDYRLDLDLVFAAPDGEPLRPDSVSAKVALLCRKLKLPMGASLHTLRHSHGSQLLAGGETLATYRSAWGTQAQQPPWASTRTFSKSTMGIPLACGRNSSARKTENTIEGAFHFGSTPSAFLLGNMVALTGIEPESCRPM